MSTTSLLAFALLVVLINLSWSQPGEAALTSDRGDPEMVTRNVREPQVFRGPRSLAAPQEWISIEEMFRRMEEANKPKEKEKDWQSCRQECKEVQDKCTKPCQDKKIESLTLPKKEYYNELPCIEECLAKNEECRKECPAIPAKPGWNPLTDDINPIQVFYDML